MKKVKIGMRSIKTGIAVVACLFIYTYTPLDDPVLAVIVAITSIQGSIDDSVTMGKNRIVGTIIGTLLGIAYKEIAQHSLILIAIGVIILITLLNMLNQSKSILVAMAVFVSIITGVVSGNTFIYGLNKFINTMLGITIGFLINYFIKPPNQIGNLKTYVLETAHQAEDTIRELIFTTNEVKLDLLKERIYEIETSLNIYNLDKKYNAVKMDKIKYVERANMIYSKIYSQIETIREKRAVLDLENSNLAKQLLGIGIEDDARNMSLENEERLQEPIASNEAYQGEDGVYDIVYNYHVKEILMEFKKVQNDIMSVSEGRAIRGGIKFRNTPWR